MKNHNLTPHNVMIVDQQNDSMSFPPSGRVVRILSERGYVPFAHVLKKYTNMATKAAIELFHEKNHRKTADNVEFSNEKITVCELAEDGAREAWGHCEDFTWEEIANEVNRQYRI